MLIHVFLVTFSTDRMFHEAGLWIMDLFWIFIFIYFCESNFIFAFGFSECAWLVFGFMC